MSGRYDPPADIEVLLAALRKHSDARAYSSMAGEQQELKEREEAARISQRDLDYKNGQVAETQAKLDVARRKVAQLINALGKTNCPEDVIKEQWKNYDKQFILPWPSGHDLAQWISKAE